MKTISKILTICFAISLFSACGIFRTKDPATHDRGVVINGVRWATRNVDAPGTFAPTPESSGMFFQWNRRVGWSSTNPMINSNGGTTWDGSNPEGTEWYAENDPCPRGWRVPTVVELRSLRNVKSEWVSNWNDTGTNGRVFGTAPNQIFLPAAGWRRSADGTHRNVGSNGIYWSSTLFGNEGAQPLNFNSGNVTVHWLCRASGFSVRCVKE